jgi:hypothetical protein
VSEPKDIVGKADAFLERYRPSQDVPVLTDVVDGAGAASEPSAAAGISEADLGALERQVVQRVIDAIQPAIASLLEQALGALREQCKAQVDSLVRDAVRDAVAKSVEREIQQLRQSRPSGR